MWKMYNPNPSGKQVGDCSIRAVTAATGESWMEAYIGVTLHGITLCDMPSSNSVWGSYLRWRGFKRKSLDEDCTDCYTVEEFCDDHPQGIFVVVLAGHVVTVKDGDYYDSWDSGKEIPLYYFEREE